MEVVFKCPSVVEVMHHLGTRRGQGFTLRTGSEVRREQLSAQGVDRHDVTVTCQTCCFVTLDVSYLELHVRRLAL